MSIYRDSIYNVQNGLANKRNALQNNVYIDNILNDAERNIISKTGLGRTIINKKFGYCLADRLVFENTQDENYYNNRLKEHVAQAWKCAGIFGRGIIVCFNPDQDLSKPRVGTVDPNSCIIRQFSGFETTVTANVNITDLRSDRYLQPVFYMVNGNNIHYSHVIDFTYVKPIQVDKSKYKFGGISEFDFIYNELKGDEICQRAGFSSIEKVSSFFYQLTGFSDELGKKNSSYIADYVAQSENLRHNNGAGIIDKEDNVFSVQQSIGADFNIIVDYCFRKISMTTGIPMRELLGDRLVGGLGNNSDWEEDSYMNMINILGTDYLITPLNQLFAMLGLGVVTFKESLSTKGKLIQAQFENQILQNAQLLYNVGVENIKSYIKDYGIVIDDELEDLFPDKKDPDVPLL